MFTLDRLLSLKWWHDYAEWIGLLVLASTLIVVVGVVLMPVMITRMRSDYFTNPAPPLDQQWARRHPVLRVLILAAKNVAGVILLLVGIALLVLPGQGILTILAGFSLVTFPGKRELELIIVRYSPVIGSLNWIRRKAGKEELALPPK